MNSPARSFGSRVNLQENSARVIEKGSTRRCQLDSTSCARHELGANLFLKISNLAAERRLRRVQLRLCREGQTSRFRQPQRNNEDVVIPFSAPMLLKHRH